jgi:drug/metabolite transporter (DMT)-like permease
MARKPSTSGLASLQTAVLLFGLAGLFGKLIEASPLIIVAGRTFFAASALCALLAWNKSRRQTLSSTALLPALAAQGIILALHWWTFFHAIQISSVAVGLLGFAAFPMFVTLLEPLCFKEPFRRIDLLTAMVVMIGLIAVAWPVDVSVQRTWGVFWGAVSGFLFAILSLFNRKFVRSMSPIVMACIHNSVAFLVLLPFAVFDSSWRLTWTQVGLLITLGVFCTALAHVLFINALKHIRAQLAGVIAALEPVYGIFFAFVLLGEKPGGTTLFGGALILAATTAAMLFRVPVSAAISKKVQS